MHQIIQHNQQVITKQHEAQKISSEIHKEQKNISKRTECVDMVFAEAHPALEAAQRAVSFLSRKRISRIKTLRHPPKKVEMVLEAVATIIYLSNKGTLLLKRETAKENAIKLVHGYARLLPFELTQLVYQFYFIPTVVRYRSRFEVKCWKDIQKMLSWNKFIPTILKFDTRTIQQKTRKKIQKKYLSNDDFSFERVNKESRVAGPFVLWVQAQIKFSHLLDSIEPMRREIIELKGKLSEKQKYVEQLCNMVKNLKLMNSEYRRKCAVIIESMVYQCKERSVDTVQEIIPSSTVNTKEMKLVIKTAYEVVKDIRGNMSELLLIGFVRKSDEVVHSAMSQETKQIMQSCVGSMEYIIADKITDMLLT